MLQSFKQCGLHCAILPVISKEDSVVDALKDRHITKALEELTTKFTRHGFKIADNAAWLQADFLHTGQRNHGTERLTGHGPSSGMMHGPSRLCLSVVVRRQRENKRVLQIPCPVPAVISEQGFLHKS